MQITFLGANQTVTGSKTLVTSGDKSLLVDCGLYQGVKKIKQHNWDKLPIEPANIDAIILTHAHIDHSGYLPAMVKNGFRGTIYASKATKDLCKLLLSDSAYLQAEQADVNPPLYDQNDVNNTINQFKIIGYGREFQIFDELSFEFQHSGHILGSCFITLKEGSTRVVFSGDLGRPFGPIMNPPAKLQIADYLILESTYGDRDHPTKDIYNQMAEAINRTIAKKGTVLMPAFSVGRTQTLLYYLYNLKKDNLISDVPIYLDSPMAINATNLLKVHYNEHKLSPALTNKICSVAHFVETAAESKQLNLNTEPKIILSASGMLEGGRVLYHLKNLIGDSKNTIVITGYQAPETIGEALISGKKNIKMFGEEQDVLANIVELKGLSAHADRNEIISWLKNFTKAPRCIYLNHGESDAPHTLQNIIIDQIGCECEIPEFGTKVTV